MNHKDARIDVERHRFRLIAVRLSHVHHGGRFIQNVRRKKLVAEHGRAGGGNPHRTQTDADEKPSPVDAFVCRSLNSLVVFFRHTYLGALADAADGARSLESIAAMEIKPVGSAGSRL